MQKRREEVLGRPVVKDYKKTVELYRVQFNQQKRDKNITHKVNFPEWKLKEFLFSNIRINQKEKKNRGRGSKDNQDGDFGQTVVSSPMKRFTPNTPVQDTIRPSVFILGVSKNGGTTCVGHFRGRELTHTLILILPMVWGLIQCNMSFYLLLKHIY